MSHNNFEIKEGAVVLCDAHYSYLRPELLNFIKDISSQKIQATQLILLGDIFDALFGGIKSSIDSNKELVDLIKQISQNIEVLNAEYNSEGIKFQKDNNIIRIQENPKFKFWFSGRVQEALTGQTLEQKVDEAMHPKNIRVEGKEDGKWTKI